jgi:hypothetical protein
MINHAGVAVEQNFARRQVKLSVILLTYTTTSSNPLDFYLNSYYKS